MSSTLDPAPTGKDSDGERRGLYEKYIVKRADGKDESEYSYFVLNLTRDPHALPAIAAYAESCRSENPELARGLMGYVKRDGQEPPTPRWLSLRDD